MAGIQDFIGMATAKLGVPAGAAKAGAGGLLELIKSQAGDGIFKQVAAVLPDAPQVVAAAPAPAPAPAAAGGGLGGLLSKAAGALGGGGGAAGLAAKLASSGISADKLPGFVKMFVDFLKSKLPPDLLKTVLSKVGDLGKLGG